MRVPVALVGLLLAACATSAPSGAPPRVAEDCVVYADAPEVYAACIRRVAAAAPEVEPARALCATLPAPGDGECRRAWVEARVQEGRGALPADMLAMCTDQPDCALLVMDNFQLPDVLAQITRCEALAGPYVAHCAGHALDTWATSHPTDADVARVGAATPRYAAAYAESVRVLRYCQGRRLADAPEGQVAAWVGCPDAGVASETCLRLYRALEESGGRRMGPTGPQALCTPLAPPGDAPAGASGTSVPLGGAPP